MSKRLRNKTGLALPEVLLAAVIIVVAVLGIVGLFPTALQNVRYGGHMSQASSLAQEMIELIRTQPFSTVPSYDGLDTRTPPGALPVAVMGHYNQWKGDIAPANPAGVLPQGWGTVTVAPVAGPPGFQLLQVTVRVGWQDSGNQTLTLVTYVAPK